MNSDSPRILVVDDEPTISGMLSEALARKNYKVTVADDGRKALESIKKEQFDLIITDVLLPDLNGMEVLKMAKHIDPDTGVIVITAHSSVESAVEAMRVGAYDYMTKGFSVDEIQMTVGKYFRFQRLVKENELLRSELATRYGIKNVIGNSAAIKHVFETVEMVAPSNATVLIQGASGTGKELIAKAIHQLSPRREEPFVKINCAAIPEGLVESELFGHEKGAFTGAIRSKKGRFELADGGTILLDEISEIQSSLQVKLLRVLQEKEFERVGSSETLQVNVRVIATTNRNLKEEVEKGNFREDLYYRLNVVPINLPVLNDRKEDIPLLVDHFVDKFCKENHRKIGGLHESALQRLMEHDWPGNVRELENTIERAVVVCREKQIQPKHLYFDATKEQTGATEKDFDFPKNMTLKDLEKRMILQTLKEHNDNRTWASQSLGISVRTLRNKLQEYRKEDAALTAEIN